MFAITSNDRRTNLHQVDLWGGVSFNWNPFTPPIRLKPKLADWALKDIKTQQEISYSIFSPSTHIVAFDLFIQIIIDQDYSI